MKSLEVTMERFIGLFKRSFISITSLENSLIYSFLSIIILYSIIIEHIGRLARMSVWDTEVDGSNPGSSTLLP